MIEMSCHCGGVALKIARAPTELTSCNCTICRRTAGLLAYYSPKDVEITGPTDIYMWGDKMIEFHRCRTCGCFTHWTPVDKTRDRMGVNMRMAEPDVVAAAKVIKFDGFKTWKVIEE